MQQRGGEDFLIGAGTVLTTQQVDEVQAIGARLIVAPNCNSTVIRAAKAHGMSVLPGVATPSEAFVALEAGADGLKMFPGELLPPTAVKAWRAVMPAGTLLLAVGGVTPGHMGAYYSATTDGFGIGSGPFKPWIDAARFGPPRGHF